MLPLEMLSFLSFLYLFQSGMEYHQTQRGYIYRQLKSERFSLNFLIGHQHFQKMWWDQKDKIIHAQFIFKHMHCLTTERSHNLPPTHLSIHTIASSHNHTFKLLHTHTIKTHKIVYLHNCMLTYSYLFSALLTD